MNINIPKIYSYADDVSIVTKKSEYGVGEIFKEYEAFSNSSGLVLNANKTEMFCFNGNREQNFEIEVDYRGERHRIVAQDRIKINGVWLLQDPYAMEEFNVQKRIDAMEKILMMWSTRHLSLLGRILIIKTFAISQFVYLFQSIKVSEQSFTRVMKMIFKYLWNRNFRGNRAPDRLKRSIMLTPVKYGGFGLIDVAKLGESLDLRSLGRTLDSNHPFFRQIRDLFDFTDFFNVKINGRVDLKLKRAVQLLNLDRSEVYRWPREKVMESVSLKTIIQNVKLSNLLTAAGKQSISYLAIHRRVRNPRVYQITLLELASISRFIKEQRLVGLLQMVVGSQYLGVADANVTECYPHKSKIMKRLTTMSSKDLRLSRSCDEENMINVFKIGMILDPGELLSWTTRLKSLTSTRHKNMLLRVAHGDIFSNSRLCRFGLRDSPSCRNCNEQVESIQHRLLECPKAREAWAKLDEAINQLQITRPSTLTIENILGAGERLDKISLALQAELLLKLSSRSEGYCPQQIARSAIQVVFNSEKLSNERRELYKNWARGL